MYNKYKKYKQKPNKNTTKIKQIFNINVQCLQSSLAQDGGANHWHHCITDLQTTLNKLFEIFEIVCFCLVWRLMVLQSFILSNDSHFLLLSPLICNHHFLSLKLTVHKEQQSLRLIGGDGS